WDSNGVAGAMACHLSSFQHEIQHEIEKRSRGSAPTASDSIAYTFLSSQPTHFLTHNGVKGWKYDVLLCPLLPGRSRNFPQAREQGCFLTRKRPAIRDEETEALVFA